MSFERFLAMLRARMGTIAGMVILGIVAAAALSILTPRRYYAESTAVLEQPLPDNAALAASGASGISYFLATQRDVAASRNVALRVIESLKLEAEPARARALLAGGNPLGAVVGWVMSLLPGSGEEATFREWLVERLLKELNVSTGRDSRLLKVGIATRDPEFSAAVANAFMRSFLDVNVHLKAAPARKETDWLKGQVAEMRESLAQAESKLAAFQQEKGIVATDERLDYENLRLQDLSTQLAAAQSESYAADARRRQLNDFAGGRGRAAEAPSEVVTSAVVMRLREDVAQREAKLKDMARELGPNHPRYRTATGELGQLRGQLDQEMRSVARGLASQGDVSGQRESGLRSSLEQQKAQILKMKKDREQMAMLARDVDNAQKAYNTAEQRVAQARIEGANERPNAAMVDEAAVPRRPSSPRIPLNLAIGAFLGAVLGLGLALQMESVQRLVRSEEDLAEYLGVPALAVLPPRTPRSAMARALGANVVSLPKP